MNETKLSEQLPLELIINNFANNISDLDIEVDSLEEAIIEVNRLKDKEGYDLFRGQSGLWPVVSSLKVLGSDPF